MDENFVIEERNAPSEAGLMVKICHIIHGIWTHHVLSVDHISVAKG